jgi:hypothetical protein
VLDPGGVDVEVDAHRRGVPAVGERDPEGAHLDCIDAKAPRARVLRQTGVAGDGDGGLQPAVDRERELAPSRVNADRRRRCRLRLRVEARAVKRSRCHGKRRAGTGRAEGHPLERHVEVVRAKCGFARAHLDRKPAVSAQAGELERARTQRRRHACRIDLHRLAVDRPCAAIPGKAIARGSPDRAAKVRDFDAGAPRERRDHAETQCLHA